MDTDKKLAAAFAAVTAYLKTEEEMIAMQAMSAADAGRQPAPVSASMWAMSGRQAMMQMRNLMQMKAFNKF